MQSQKQTILEISLNTLSGFIISWVMTLTILNGYGYSVSSTQSAQITVIFTIVSVARAYVWRRIFNYYASRNYSRYCVGGSHYMRSPNKDLE